jgi:hypothetical protein
LSKKKKKKVMECGEQKTSKFPDSYGIGSRFVYYFDVNRKKLYFSEIGMESVYSLEMECEGSLVIIGNALYFSSESCPLSYAFISVEKKGANKAILKEFLKEPAILIPDPSRRERFYMKTLHSNKVFVITPSKRQAKKPSEIDRISEVDHISISLNYILVTKTEARLELWPRFDFQQFPLWTKKGEPGHRYYIDDNFKYDVFNKRVKKTPIESPHDDQLRAEVFNVGKFWLTNSKFAYCPNDKNDGLLYICEDSAYTVELYEYKAVWKKKQCHGVEEGNTKVPEIDAYTNCILRSLKDYQNQITAASKENLKKYDDISKLVEIKLEQVSTRSTYLRIEKLINNNNITDALHVTCCLTDDKMFYKYAGQIIRDNNIDMYDLGSLYPTVIERFAKLLPDHPECADVIENLMLSIDESRLKYPIYRRTGANVLKASIETFKKSKNQYDVSQSLRKITHYAASFLKKK